jgi:tRNA threonylcarbamoyladenosine biosynthesis protein TsaE
MEFPFEVMINSERDTEKIALQFAGSLNKGDIVAFIGNLGTGKTFFIKKIAKYFGIEEVTSPTFSIVNTYYGSIKINHFDFYRIKREVELYDIGFEEYLSDASAITLIEWADMFYRILPKNVFRIEITHQGGTKRKIKINKK